ncbi:MAG: hypothetical protein AAF311_11305 [Pseudomonadota bacterium]
MPQSDLERLVVSLSADQRQLEKALDRAERRMNRAAGNVEKRAARMTKNVNASLGAVGAKLLKGGAGALGVAGVGIGAGFGFSKVIKEAREATRVFDELAKTARTLGVSTDLFQSLEFAAVEQGVAIDKLNGGLKTFTVRLGEAKVEQGQLFSVLRKSNPELLQQLQNARSVDNAIGLMADAIQQASSAEEKARLTRAAFSKASVDLVRVLGDGSAGLKDFTDRAREMGLIIENDVLTRAEDMENKLGIAAKVIDTNLKTAFIEITPFIVSAAEAIASVARSLNDFLDSYRSVTDATSRGVNSRIDAAMAERARLVESLQNERESAGALRPIGAELIEADIRKQDQIIRGLQNELRKRAESGSLAEFGRLPITTSEDSATSPSGGGGRGGSSRSAAIDAAERQREAVADLLKEIQFEREQLGRTADQQEIMNALRRVSVDLTSQEGQQIAQAITLRQQEEAQIERNTELQRAAQDAASYLGQQLEGALTAAINGTQSLEDALKAMIVQLGIAAAKGALLGEGPLGALLGGKEGGGLIGRLFADAPKFHSGGIVGRPGGLRSDEVPAILQRGEMVIPKAMLSPNLDVPALAMSQRRDTNVTVRVDVTGARGNAEIETMVRSGVQQGMAQVRAEVPGMAVGAVQTARSRGLQI